VNWSQHYCLYLYRSTPNPNQEGRRQRILQSIMHPERRREWVSVLIPDTRRAILVEISNVACALPELHVANPSERFAVDKLEATVNTMIGKTFHTTCSMAWGFASRSRNGSQVYNVKRGKENGIAAPINEELVEKVGMRLSLN
jgi:hypothetical protein